MLRAPRIWTAVRCGFSLKPSQFCRSVATRRTKLAQLTAVPQNEVVQARPREPKLFDRRTENGVGHFQFGYDLADALLETGIEKLTEIQTKAVPVIRNSKNVVIASHTGSGKTLAYLLPIVEQLKSGEEIEGATESLRTKRPRAIVLAPTRELSDQILKVAKSLSHHAKFCSMSLNGGTKAKIQRQNLALHQDLVVATPSKLLEHHEAQNIFLRDIQVLVLDEADTMYDEKFYPDIERIVRILQRKQSHCQFILVAATLTRKARMMMREMFPGLEFIQTDSLHKGVVGSVHNFISLKPKEDKIRLLRDVLSEDIHKRSKVLVFCNTLSSCRCIEHTLQENDIPTMCYHGEMPKKERRQIIANFSDINREEHILVCTDVAARGLDIPGNVDHVINFDFPRTSLDYLHRTGRTARAGATGNVTSLVTGKDRVLADRIQWAVGHSQPLDAITSNRNVLPPTMWPTLNPMKGNAKKTSYKGLRGRRRSTVMNKVAKFKSSRQKFTGAKNRQTKGRSGSMISKPPAAKRSKSRTVNSKQSR